MWTLGTSWNCCLRYAITAVTRENGSSRDPYPPTTVSLLTNPRFDFRSARTTFISHLNPPYSTQTLKTAAQAVNGGPRGDFGENVRVRGCQSSGPTSSPSGCSVGVARTSALMLAAGASFWIAAC